MNSTVWFIVSFRNKKLHFASRTKEIIWTMWIVHIRSLGNQKPIGVHCFCSTELVTSLVTFSSSRFFFSIVFHPSFVRQFYCFLSVFFFINSVRNITQMNLLQFNRSAFISRFSHVLFYSLTFIFFYCSPYSVAQLKGFSL